ncbi:hypothetical protein BASA50_007785 [Batrachochytrium salamandrivorans]|uniref:Uncharacterized protein n=1 Tax=Batrachochytrium salamandrivorans TaxID=1357716 RepID=A0ABQ8F623_9FUNG|nr:hypothetical protein BASA50_007785 [Batrachochytrium salamandrivorans]
MKFSTGVILSILSANVFAIEHLNGAHSGSLLARRAVVADTDGPFLQKRNNGEEQEEQEEQAKPKVSSDPNPDSSQKPYVYVKDTFDFYKNYKPGDSTQEGRTDFPVYVLTQDDKGKGARKKGYTGLGSGRGKSRFANAFGESSSRVLGSIKNRLSREKPEVGLIDTKQSALDASNRVVDHFGGRVGIAIGGEVYAMLKHAEKTSQGYQGLYKNPKTSPFRLELPPSTSDVLKQKYNGLQDNVQRHIQSHISDIKFAIEHITDRPKHVIYWLDQLMTQTDDFFMGIFKMKNVYPEWLKELGISDNVYLKGLEMHTKDAEEYKHSLSNRFGTIKKMVENHRENSKKSRLLKSLSSVMGSKGRLGIKTKSSKDGALLENVELEEDE